MFDFLVAGGLTITIPMTILLIAAIVVIFMTVIARPDVSREHSLARINYIKYLGILALTLGIFGQVLGLYDALKAIEAMGDVAPAMVYGGIKVSSISTIYGFSIFLICYTAWLVLKIKIERATQAG